MTAKQVSLEPRYNKEEFEKKLPSRDDRLDMKFPKVVLNKMDWWSLANDEIFFAEEADIYDARIKDYIDMSVPVTSYPRMDNFPSQLFLRVPLKIKIDKLNVHNMNVVSEEYNPTTKRSSNIYFDKVHGTLKNLANLSAAIKKNKNVSFSGSCLFMHQISCKCSFQFNLSKYQTGNFSVDLHMAALDKTVLNPFTEPLSLFTVKSGSMQEATTHLEGNNFTTSCKLLMLYNDLHITPLKPDDNDSSKLKKKSVMSFFANKFFIKNANPSHGDTPRYSEVIVQRAHNGFFNFVWKTILTSISKTVGIPLKYANK